MDVLVGIFGLTFVALHIVRAWAVYRASGRTPFSFRGREGRHGLLYKLLASVVALEAVSILFLRSKYYAPSLGLYDWLVPVGALSTPTVQVIGLVLAYGGLVWSAVAQIQMGRNWRYGLDEGGETDVVRHGLFRIMRHPIYAGMAVVVVGLFLAMPNLVTLACLIAGPIILQRIARVEEEEQTARHGDAYRRYAFTR